MFFANNFWTKKDSDNFGSIVFLTSSRAELALKCQCQNLTSGHVRSRVKPSSSYCISYDAFLQEKHIGTIPSDLSLFYQKSEAKNKCDLE